MKKGYLSMRSLKWEASIRYTVKEWMNIIIWNENESIYFYT